MSRKIAFYDCEIAKCVPDRYYDNDPKYEYCKGWHDKAGMGIACIAVYTNWSGYHVFLGSELAEFQQLMSGADEIVGFNSIDFDDQLLAANGIQIKTTYDLLCETRIASGQPPHYTRGKTRGGYSLEQMSQANLGRGKSGTGALAPEQWQDGKYRKVIDYCLNDIGLLRELYERRSRIVDPTNGSILLLRGGNRWEWLKARWELGIKAARAGWQESHWRVFLWAIASSDISEAQILFRSPVIFSSYLRPPTFWVQLRKPALLIRMPRRIVQEFEKKTGQSLDDIPF